MKVSVPCPDPFSILTCHLHNLHLLLVQCPCAPTMATAPWVMLDDPPALGAPAHTNHSCSIPSNACLALVQHLCVHAYSHMGSFNKKGEFPTVPYHLCSSTMAVASQAMLDGPPTLAVQHPHVHQKGEMNATTMTMQQQPSLSSFLCLSCAFQVSASHSAPFCVLACLSCTLQVMRQQQQQQ